MTSQPPHTDWTRLFSQERTRLLAALGNLTAGGIVEHIAHIGATSVAGLPATPCLDIGLAVWPFPLQANHQAAIEALGYALLSGYESKPEQRFCHATEPPVQLFIVDAGSTRWTNYLLRRDYLRHDQAGCEQYAQEKEAASNEVSKKAALFSRWLAPASQWWVRHHGFAPVEQVVRELEGYAHPWYISSGWALDLYLDRVTRVHHDVDVVVTYRQQLPLQAYLMKRDWTLLTPFEKKFSFWPRHMRLEHPRHQVHAHRDGAFIDFLFSEITPSLWWYRRDAKIMRAAERMSLSTPDGIPYLAPELVLLFKSKNTSGTQRPKDLIDFEQVLPHLEEERRAWLRWALMATNPTHPWIERLA